MKKHVLLFLLTAPPYGAFLLIGDYLFRSGVNTALPFFGWLLLLMVLGAAASADSRPVAFGTLCSLLFSYLLAAFAVPPADAWYFKPCWPPDATLVLSAVQGLVLAVSGWTWRHREGIARRWYGGD